MTRIGGRFLTFRERLPAAPRRRGSALMVALWVTGLLSLMVASFAFEMHVEAQVVSYCRKRLKAEYLSRAGIELATLLQAKISEVKELDPKDLSRQDIPSDQPWYEPARRLKHGLSVLGLRCPLGEGEIILDIVPEPGRRNLNGNLTDDDWERMLDMSGVPETVWSQLIDSFNDWRDPDNNPNVEGAETDDYYSRLLPPYKAKNGSLDTVDELLLIRGFTAPILYGGVPADAPEGTPPMTGIADLLTTYGDGKVNVNAASKRVLMSLPGIDGNASLSDDIIREREGLTGNSLNRQDTYFKDPADFFSRFPELGKSRQQLEPLISTQSSIYRILSVGNVGGVRRIISCTVQFGGQRLQILRWTEQEG